MVYKHFHQFIEYNTEIFIMEQKNTFKPLLLIIIPDKIVIIDTK
jgi:hypothetical protein